MPEVEIKQEPIDSDAEEERSTNRVRSDDITELLTRVFNAESKYQKLEDTTKTLKEFIEQQQTEIVVLKDKCTTLANKNQTLEQSLEQQQGKNIQLEEDLRDGLLGANNARNRLKDELREQLTTTEQSITSRMEQRNQQLQEDNSRFQARLTATEQGHNQTLLTRFSTLENKLTNTIHDLKETYNKHQHPYTDHTLYMGNQVDDPRTTKLPEPKMAL